MKEALVIVHLSSLDAYTDMSYDAEGHGVHGEELAFEISRAIRTHRGPVYIIDQGWEIEDSRASRPRAELLEEIKSRKDIVWMHFDEADEEWGPFLRELRKRLRDDGVTRARVGGIWYHYDETEGCATEVAVHLRKLMPIKVDPSLVGCESDFMWPEDEEEEGEED